jgi:hypothetical protein
MPHKKLARPAYEGYLPLPTISTTAHIAFEYLDVMECQAIVFEWAESFDTKDWARLSSCVAPTLYVRV